MAWNPLLIALALPLFAITLTKLLIGRWFLAAGVVGEKHATYTLIMNMPTLKKNGLAAAILVSATALLCSGSGMAVEPGPAPGTVIKVVPAEMPPPYATGSVANRAQSIDRPPGARLSVPAGFRAEIFADDLTHARWMAVAHDGAIFVAEPRPGKITRLVDADGDGRAEDRSTFVSGLRGPHGLAIQNGYLYVADTRRVWRMPYRAGQRESDGPPEPVTADGALGSGHGHWTRIAAFAPDGNHFFVSIGSAGNIAEEESPRATVQRFDAEGGKQETFASGLRNPVGMAFYPGTDDLYVVVNERDGMGDGLVPDYLTRVERGAFYGWPYAYIGPNPQPGFADKRPDLVAKSQVPDLLFQSHSAPLGLVFYDAEMFPPKYRGDAFVALHGSWNAAEPRGYMVVRVPFEKGRPIGHYEAFATGFWAAGDDTAEVWGRPAGLAVAADGSLLIADDVGQVVWRVSYTGEGAAQ